MKRFLLGAVLLIGATCTAGWALAKLRAEPEIDSASAAVAHLLALPSCEIHQARSEKALDRAAIESKMNARRDAMSTALPGFAEMSAHGPSPVTPDAPFPIALKAEFDLVDQYGKRRTEQEFLGQTYAVFFGYASCEAICSAVLPDIANAMDQLAAAGHDIETVMISVDPERDTPDAMGANLAKWHPNLTGLTGSPEQLEAARRLFQVAVSEVGKDDIGEPIYAHGSLIYLVGPDGTLQTILPPVFAPEHLAKVIKGYIERSQTENRKDTRGNIRVCRLSARPLLLGRTDPCPSHRP
ncbi:cytochrome oxidase Cu insertion factor (SCO1/SenC/PrrC family) [Roseibium hamelinense]|uniref:Cytochrome oxidase Cu insertion factor (SCO1/SenC/PrrC family) n=1 Tax=Roseibium hamelinense TaxID=150831 RepID=A0A562TA38_9HYPH|nr:SCO family protein [Roseibium hamelinense]TWI90472.1 cytochrome oxidase Cu insertion factor (SCO1/SenC/PrrC family) [Roseibium hamelinense]